MKRAFGVLSAVVAVAVLPTSSAWAQQRGDANHEWCEDVGRGDRRQERYCEVREFTISARDLLDVDAGPNGGITVEGWDGNEIQVLARVQGWSRDDDPESFMDMIEVAIDGGTIRSEGPRSRELGRNNGWSVSYDIMVPRNTSLALETVNGGIDITDVKGDLEFRTTNGGIRLTGAAGDVRGRTTNGGIRVELDGDQWDGAGIDVQTTNGGITLYVPENFRADLEIGTVNGGFEIDFPITVQGRLNRRRIQTQLNGGGPTVRAVTTNGGVKVLRG